MAENGAFLASVDADTHYLQWDEISPVFGASAPFLATSGVYVFPRPLSSGFLTAHIVDHQWAYVYEWRTYVHVSQLPLGGEFVCWQRVTDEDRRRVRTLAREIVDEERGL